MRKSQIAFEVIKCLMLAAIAIILFGIYQRTPTPYTIKDLQEGKIKIWQIPTVSVAGGNVNVDGNIRVDGGYIDAEVTGSVRIER